MFKETALRSYIFASGLVAAFAPGLAQAAGVYDGCATPTLKPGHHTFYIDPKKGSAKGDGSAAKPWRTLAEVVANNLIASKGHNWRTWSSGDTSLIDVNAKAPIKAGDVIMLMSGDHGAVTLSNMYNSDFITVMAAPGQTPTLSRLLFTSAGKWNFQGIQIIGQKPTGYGRVDGLATVGYSEWLGSSSNIVMQDMRFAATNDTSSWSPTDWVSAPYAYAIFLSYGSTCTAVTNSHIENAYGGVAISGSQVLLQGNTIEKMTNDGIDILASDVLVANNTIKNGMNSTASTDHADGIQGWSITQAGKAVTNKNVTVTGNTVIKTGKTSVSYMQGIAIFDGSWDNLNITNNVVVSNAWHGISVSGVKNGAVINNTVIASDTSTGTWLMVRGVSGAVTVRNNIAPSLNFDGPGIVDDHNVVATAGKYSAADKYDPTIMSKFVALNNVNATYDLRPKSGNPAIGFGSADKAPLVDIVGKKRLPVVSAGAYN